MNAKNLKPWQPGVSGNTKGRPKGSRNIKNVIRDLLSDPGTYNMLPSNTYGNARTPLEAIVRVLMIKSIRGDVRAADVLLKYAVDRDQSMEEGSFFTQKKLIIEVVGDRQNPNNPIQDESHDKIDPETIAAGVPPETEVVASTVS